MAAATATAAAASAVVAEEDTELRDLLVQTLENSGVLNRIKVRREAGLRPGRAGLPGASRRLPSPGAGGYGGAGRGGGGGARGRGARDRDRDRDRGPGVGPSARRAARDRPTLHLRAGGPPGAGLCHSDGRSVRN